MRFEPQRKQAPFEGSRRQARGRLLERLRTGPVAEGDPEAPAEIVAALVRDGLAEIQDGAITLPAG